MQGMPTNTPTDFVDREFQEGSRTRYLFYRCERGHGVTALQLEAAWVKAEKFNAEYPMDVAHHAEICFCGSRKISPSNPSIWEELTSPAIWKLWFLRVFLPRFQK